MFAAKTIDKIACVVLFCRDRIALIFALDKSLLLWYVSVNLLLSCNNREICGRMNYAQKNTPPKN
jgi:hypothetical protein